MALMGTLPRYMLLALSDLAGCATAQLEKTDQPGVFTGFIRPTGVIVNVKP